MSFLDLLFPKSCLECGDIGKYLCDNCLRNVSPGGWKGGTYSVFRYEGVVRKAVVALKYKFAAQIAAELAEISVPRIKNLNLEPNNILLVPIPLHIQRENWRGFNQAEVVGRKITKELKWNFDSDLLVKSKKTSPQIDLKGVSRRENLRGVFGINMNHKQSLVSSADKSFIIFDDVATTGSTIFEAKKALLSAGAKNIWGLTIAR